MIKICIKCQIRKESSPETEDQEFQKSFALSNLQLMWAEENASKGNRYSGRFQIA